MHRMHIFIFPTKINDSHLTQTM